MRIKSWTTEDRIVRSLEDLRVLRIEYLDIQDNITLRDIEPLCLYTCNQDYDMVFAYCRLRNDYRLFKVDNIQWASLLYKTYSADNHSRRLLNQILRIGEQSGFEGEAEEIIECVVENNNIVTVNI